MYTCVKSYAFDMVACNHHANVEKETKTGGFHMKKVSCILLAALLMLLCSVAMAECAHDFSGDIVFVDGATCATSCTLCGEPDPEAEQPHFVFCTTGTACVYCKAPLAELTSYEKWCTGGDRQYDDTYCWEVCTGCGEVTNKTTHFGGYCDSPLGTCNFCGQPCEPEHAWEETVRVESTCKEAGKIVYECANGCGETKEEALPLSDSHETMNETASTNPTCKELGTQTWTCPDCGYEEVTTWGEVGECWFELTHDQNNHWFECAGCGAIDGDKMPHEVSCVTAGKCNYCGATGVTGETSHALTGEWKHDQTSHWMECPDCKEKIMNWEHWAYCNAADTCINCGAAGVTIVVYHDYDEAGKCTICGQTEVIPEHDHVWEVTETVAATCTEFGNEHSECTICGEGSDKQIYPTGHYWIHTTTKNPTCTKEGRHNYECRDCDATSIKKLPATGHTMVLTATGSACSTCGYAEEAALAVTPVENVAVEGENLSADVTLVVDQPQEDVSALLPEAVRADLQQVYMVKLLEKGEAIEPNGSIKVSIQLEEGADLTGKKLMLLTAEGELVEIAYEVVDGKLTFVTEAIGIFVLVDAPAE